MTKTQSKAMTYFWGAFLIVIAYAAAEGVRLDNELRNLPTAVDTVEVEPPAELDTLVTLEALELARAHWVALYARQAGVDPQWLYAISRTENTRALPYAWSSTGCCVGAMQVNVRHYGDYDTECEGSDFIHSMRINVCYGAYIWRSKLVPCNFNIECSLRKYVGQRYNIAVGDRYVSDVGKEWLAL